MSRYSNHVVSNAIVILASLSLASGLASEVSFQTHSSDVFNELALTVVTTEATTPHQNYSGLSALASINLAVPHVLSSSETSSLHSTSRPRTRSSSVNTDARISTEEARKGSAIVSPTRKSVGQLPSPTVSNNSNSSGGRSISKSQSIENGIGSTSSARATLVPLSNQTTRDSMEATGPDAMLGDRAFMSMSDFGDYDGIINQLGTGYAVASSKRNAEFHSLFKSIPDDDYLIEGTLEKMIHELVANVSLFLSVQITVALCKEKS
jgi:hypothetical protein